MKRYAIIVAGGKGSRFESTIPKQFVPLRGIPVLMHTIKAFHSTDNSISILLALPKGQIAYWQSLCKEYSFTIPHIIIEGGDTRFQSVKNCLTTISSLDGVVAIHDGVRPLITKEIITKAYEVAEIKGSAIPVIAVTDSIRMKDEHGSKAMKRDNLVAVQTPQTFRCNLIIEAYKTPFSDRYTDDASVFENSGHEIVLIDGNSKNIKITNPFDIALAELLLNNE
ncbi:MAG: 2-C-methyl-D-erythritol 4-phosphate cytidylyltransferase [Muribaculaceae bacterium]